MPRGCTRYGGIFDLDTRQERLTEVLRELEDPKAWDNPERAQELNRERARLEEVVGGLRELTQGIADSLELAELIELENDEAAADSLSTDVLRLEQHVQRLEFQRMFSGEADANNA